MNNVLNKDGIMPTIATIYTKNGAIFPDADAANTDRSQFISFELFQLINNSYNALRDDGVLHGEILEEWNQDTFTLTVLRNVSDVDAYQTSIAGWRDNVTEMTEQAGWTFVKTEVLE